MNTTIGIFSNFLSKMLPVSKIKSHTKSKHNKPGKLHSDPSALHLQVDEVLNNVLINSYVILVK